jgi:hypothetical protein
MTFAERGHQSLADVGAEVSSDLQQGLDLALRGDR